MVAKFLKIKKISKYNDVIDVLVAAILGSIRINKLSGDLPLVKTKPQKRSFVNLNKL